MARTQTHTHAHTQTHTHTRTGTAIDCEGNKRSIAAIIGERINNDKFRTSQYEIVFCDVLETDWTDTAWVNCDQVVATPQELVDLARIREAAFKARTASLNAKLEMVKQVQFNMSKRKQEFGDSINKIAKKEKPAAVEKKAAAEKEAAHKV